MNDAAKSTLFVFLGIGGASLGIALIFGAVGVLFDKVYRGFGNPGGLLKDEGPGQRGRGPGEGLYDNPGGLG